MRSIQAMSIQSGAGMKSSRRNAPFSAFMILILSLCFAGPMESAAQNPSAKSPFWTQRVAMEGNILFDDSTLARVVDLGGGITITPGMTELLVEEVKAFYASHGHFLVKVFPAGEALPRRGVLTLMVDEREEMKNAGADEARAIRSVERLVRVKKLTADKQTKDFAAAKLVRAYQAKRFADSRAERERIAVQRRKVENRQALSRTNRGAPPTGRSGTQGPLE